MPMFRDQQMCRCAQHGRDGFHSDAAPTHYAPDLTLEPTHIDIGLKVDPDDESAEGTVTTTVRARSAGERTITLNAVDFEIADIADEDGNDLQYAYDGAELVVTWSDEFDAGEERRVAVTYRVDQPIAGLYFSHPTDDDPGAPRWAATDHETERARYWLPCIDHPNVRTTLSFQLEAQADFTILANGSEQESVAASGSTRIAQWDLDFPCPSYLICFALGEFTALDDGDFDGLPVAYYASSQWTPDHLDRTFGRTKEMLSWMTEKLDRPFPFPKYYQFALPGIGGAMENISLVSWDEIFVLDEDLAREWTWLVDQVNVHEMAHSYFGDAVVCRDFSHVWLKESWATYMEQCWLEDKRGVDEQQYDFYRNAHAYFSEADDSYKRPMVTRRFDSSWDMYDRHLYPGGACRLHTLRYFIGDGPFWSAVTDYLATFEGMVVETEDFRRIMEKHSGKSLARFFDQWFYTANYPHLKISFAHSEDRGEGTFTIEQKQADEDGSGDVFDLRLALCWTIGGEHRSETVRLDRAKQTFRFEMSADPQMVRVDPDGKVLHKQEFAAGDTKLRYQLEHGESIIDRIRAAHELAKTGKRRNLTAIVDRYHAEDFWGVRQQFASALADAKTAFAVDALATLVAEEDDPMVLGHVIGRAGTFRDGGIEEVIEQRVERGELAPWAQRLAWSALGAQRESADVERLAEAAREASLHDIARNGAVEALGASRQSAALEPLVELTASSSGSYRMRSVAAAALGQLGGVLERKESERVREVLETLLRDEEEVVAKAAAAALATMGARSSAEAVERLAARLSHQDAVGIRRIVERIHKGEDGKVAAVESQLESLRADFRKLSERLEKLEPND